MSPRLRVWLVVGAAALVAAGATAGATLLSRNDPGDSPVGLRGGTPPLLIDLGLRTDPEARDLRTASALLDRGRPLAARGLFQKWDSVEARLGAAIAEWPDSLPRIVALADANQRSAAAQLHLGLVRYWQQREEVARGIWRRVRKLAPDSSYAVRAGDLLHPEDPVPGLPFFVPSFESAPDLAGLSPPAQFALLRRRAASGGARARIELGVALQRLGRPLSARRQFRLAAEAAPNDPEAQTAAAVGLFDKDDPSRAFSRLGPLGRRFPKAQTVRFHLGLMLIWTGRVTEAKRQLGLARSLGPDTELGRQADRFLTSLTGSAK